MPLIPPLKAHAIARGRQTTLRLPPQRGKAGAPVAPCRFVAGHEYAIPKPLTDSERQAIKRGHEPDPLPLGHVRVASVVREALWITEQQAKTEGHKTPGDFKRAWVREHDHLWLARHAHDLAWARYAGQGAVSWILLERYRRRWEGRDVWVVSFELVAGVRYLAQPDPVKAQGDYTPTPSRSIDPLPVIDDMVLAQYAKTAEAFCLGKQLERRRAAEAGRVERGRSFRQAA